MQGPVDIITAKPYNSWTSLQAIARFGLANAFPTGKDHATFAEIAAQSGGLPEPHVRRLLRHEMTFRIFQEPSEGVVRHTAASKLLAEDPMLRQWTGMIFEELWPAATKTIDALAKWPGSEEPNHTGFNIAHNTPAVIFDEITKHPDRDQRYADAMTFTSTRPGLQPHNSLNGNTTGLALSADSTVVDIGGSHGSLSIALADQTTVPQKLRFIVQDLPQVTALGEKNLPGRLRDRITFMPHDFFQEQPVKGAEVYMLRWILHDWSDKYALKILRALIPALKKGATVLLFEQIVPGRGEVPVYQERAIRSVDLTMWATHNGKEREMEDWKRLFNLAGGEGGFEITAVVRPKGSRLSIIEATWKGGG